MICVNATCPESVNAAFPESFRCCEFRFPIFLSFTEPAGRWLDRQSGQKNPIPDSLRTAASVPYATICRKPTVDALQVASALDVRIDFECLQCRQTRASCLRSEIDLDCVPSIPFAPTDNDSPLCPGPAAAKVDCLLPSIGIRTINMSVFPDRKLLSIQNCLSTSRPYT